MVRVERIDEKSHVLILDNVRACWLIRDRRNVLIESGIPADVPSLKQGLSELGMTAGDIDVVALTHVHVDHAGGAAYLARQNPAMRVCAHAEGTRHLVNPVKLVESVRRAYGGKFSAVGEMAALPSRKMVRTVGSGDCIDLGATRLEVYDTPGHAKHHVVYFDRRGGTLYAGDALGSRYPGLPNFVLSPPSDYDKELAQQSIDLIARLNPRRIIFTHCGPWDFDADGDFYDTLKNKHDLWTRVLADVIRADPGIERRLLLDRFLERLPELKQYPDQFFSFNLSVNGIYIYLKRAGLI